MFNLVEMVLKRLSQTLFSLHCIFPRARHISITIFHGEPYDQRNAAFTFTYLLTAGVVSAPQMTSQPVSPIFLCSTLPSGTLQELHAFCLFQARFDVVVHLPVFLRSFRFETFLPPFSPFVAQIRMFCSGSGFFLLVMFAKDFTGCNVLEIFQAVRGVKFAPLIRCATGQEEDIIPLKN